MTAAETIVQRQLDCYNAKDRVGWLATYSADAQQFDLQGSLLASGHDEIGARIAIRFAEPDLQVRLLSRTVMGNVVVDHEEITRNFPEGIGTVEMICIYEVADAVIRRATFALGEKKLRAQAQFD